MSASAVSGLTTALYILIELIQFAYIAYQMWRDRHNVANRNYERIRTTFATA